MAIPITLDVTLPKDPQLFVRDHNRSLRTALEKAAEFHHEKHIPRHFEPFASVKYRYKKRSIAYDKVKERIFGHKQPLVLTGTTRDTVTKQRTIRATPKRSTLKMPVPIKGGSGRYLSDEAAERLYKAGKRKFRKVTRRSFDSAMRVRQILTEIEIIAADELRRLIKEIQDVYSQEAAAVKAAGRVRKRVKIQ